MLGRDVKHYHCLETAMLRHSRQRGIQIYHGTTEIVHVCRCHPFLALYMPGTSNSNQYIDVFQIFHVFWTLL